ncbi:MAG: 50S ribosomal protein L29 [Aphanocapsa feldmannii 277cV]|uniref:Large ribosomal subunit protein uL29 n=2 Tax=Aphanocapsa feldmannii TaxID=192050 RepID=A0A524RMR3_9CHRO|nr:MAG: 50S ribosomal protein L29 [Aphanocapsa feldmannii 288cV]TGG91935.1 MAG: 50S ribosomal protein L29 [Aphanocapsa feldmannii 277cV]TGH28118.1 MAG: 50S ribosomal protein L29 [Aphanocapsa feldmannii 277cI]
MATNPLSELRELDDAALTEQIAATRRELFDLRFQQATRQLNKSHRFRTSRVRLAQLLTIRSERRLTSNT